MPRPINGVPQGTVDICFAHKDFMLDTAGHWTVAFCGHAKTAALNSEQPLRRMREVSTFCTASGRRCKRDR